MSLRYDTLELARPVKTPAGYLRTEGFLTRTGVFEYKDAAGNTIRELRHPDDVLLPASLNTLPGVPICDEHPPEQQLDATSAKKYQRGSVGDTVEVQGPPQRAKIKARLTITDADLIREIESGERREISCGYSCEPVVESGIYDGQPYDARQTNIVYNHIAVVKKGRAGPDIRLRADGAAVLVSAVASAGVGAIATKHAKGYKDRVTTSVSKGQKMAQTKASLEAHKITLRVDDKDYEMDDDTKHAVDALIGKQLLAAAKKKAKEEPEEQGEKDPAAAKKQAQEPAEGGMPEHDDDDGDDNELAMAHGEDDPDKDDEAEEDPTAQKEYGKGKDLAAAGEAQGPKDKGMGGNKDKKDKGKKDMKSGQEKYGAHDSADGLKGRIDALESENKRLKEKTSPEAIAQVVEERAALLEAAKHFGAKADSRMDSQEIKTAVLAKLAPEMDLKDKSKEYIDGAYVTVTALVENAPSEGFLRLKAAAANPKTDSATVSAYEQMVKRNAEGWKQPLKN